MFELFKLVWDVVVLRDTARKGKYNWRIWPIAFGMVLFLYGGGLSAALFYEKYPQHERVFIAILVFDVLVFLGALLWAWRWQSRMAAARKLELRQSGEGRQPLQ